MSLKASHERICPALAVPFDTLVDAANRGEYHWSEREARLQDERNAEAWLTRVKRGTENCSGLEVITDEDEIKIYCPAKDITWTRSEVEEMYKGGQGSRPSLYFALQLIDGETVIQT